MMFKRLFILVPLVLLVLSCSESDSDEIPQINSEDILINIEPEERIQQKNVVITVTSVVEIESLQVFIDDQLITSFSAAPYEYELTGSDFEDGEHTFKAVVEDVNGNTQQNSVVFLTDSNGPYVYISDIIPQRTICDTKQFSPTIRDEVSEVVSVQFYMNDELVATSQNETNPNFVIFPSLYPNGENEIKLVMEDALGNVSEETYTVKIGSTTVKVALPDNFIDSQYYEMYVMLSDSDGEFLDMKKYNNIPQTFELCSIIDSDDTEYIITFFEVFDESIFYVYSYANLTMDNIGEEILIKPRSSKSSSTIVNFSLENLNLGLNKLTARGQGYSMVTLDNELRGTRSTSFLNSLWTPNTFVRGYFNDGFKYAFINNIHNKTSLLPSDFTDANVVTNPISFNNQITDDVYLSILGFEDQQSMEYIAEHELYRQELPLVSVGNFSYFYPDIFHEYHFSLNYEGFTLQGLGLPPSFFTFPDLSISYSLSNGKLLFQGLPNYEVGRTYMRNEPTPGQPSPSNPVVTMYIMFDGSSNSVSIPKIPNGMFSVQAREVFNNADFEFVRASAENYQTFSTYQDYLQNVFVNSTPYYLSSPSRRIVGDGATNFNEYPYFTN